MLNLLLKTRQNSYAVNTRGGIGVENMYACDSLRGRLQGMPLTYCTMKRRSNLLSISGFQLVESVWNNFRQAAFSTAGAAIFSPFHLFTLSPFHLFTFSPFHSFTLLIFSPLISSSPNSRSSSWVRVSKSGVAVSVRWGGAGAARVGANTSCWCPCSVVWMCFSRT